MTANYDFNTIEPRWQKCWSEQRCFAAANPGQPGADKPKYYVLDFFPYPSGAGLHVGHPLGYIASDIISRFMRMRGYNVLHPMGWDAFGLPAEQYAVETGVHPAVTTRKNIETYKRQLQQLGLSYDWDREIATCEPDYYHWTQWIFLKIFNSWYDPEHRWTDAAGRKVIGAARPIDTLPIPPDVRAEGEEAIAAFRDEHRLAYLAEVPVNWCPALGTVLANEEVTADGRSERGNHPVFRRPMKQWMLRITEYADRLLADLNELDWPEPIKLMQRNWIGRSEGAYVDFAIDDGDDNVIRVYTTRPDTLYGATFMVLAPEHRLVPAITTPEQRAAVDEYVAAAARKSERERTAEAREKTGVFTGAYAINPVNHERIPIWIADYVLAGYGTGSIMAVPGSDKRDLEFAEKFGLNVVQVVQPTDGSDWRGYEAEGVACNSPPEQGQRFEGQCVLNGLPTPEAKRKIIAWLEERDLGEGTVQYKLRDWLFSRQRYWGEPFPILYDESGRAIGENEANLPVVLPEMDDFRPHASDDPDAEPQTPLSRAQEWVRVRRDGREYRRETNTMPQWAGSCWYYLRFCDPRNDQALIDERVEKYWMTGREDGKGDRFGGVDLYIGGAEHAVLHLLYARFWHKLLYDLGYVTTPEPFAKLFNQGYIQAAAYTDERGVYVEAAKVEERDGRFFYEGRPVTQTFGKMGKSLKNVVNPDQIVREYGADTLRLYEMYMGPLEASKPWNTRDIIGVHRFLQRVWKLIVAPTNEGDPAAGWTLHPRIGDQRDDSLERLLHKTIKKVQEDIERFAFNTAIAEMIKWTNEAQRAASIHRDQIERFLRILAPFAPHICEELWRRLGHDDLLAAAQWPAYDDALTRDELVEIAVQVRGKVRARIMVAPDASDEEVIAAAKTQPRVAQELEGKEIRRAIVAKGRLVNLIY
ncbi:MAG: leucine--tRNA ligase [Planctomycetota bacterium]|nr:MAG: leucine--tRNA ligase [Planctomycetota bacterium]